MFKFYSVSKNNFLKHKRIVKDYTVKLVSREIRHFWHNDFFRQRMLNFAWLSVKKNWARLVVNVWWHSSRLKNRHNWKRPAYTFSRHNQCSIVFNSVQLKRNRNSISIQSLVHSSQCEQQKIKYDIFNSLSVLFVDEHNFP